MQATEARGQSVDTGHSVCLGWWPERDGGEDEESQMGVFSRGGSRPGRLGGERNEGGGCQSQKQQCLSSGLYGRLGGTAGNDPEE